MQTIDLGKPTCVHIPPGKKSEFRRLVSPPEYALPTIALAALVFSTVLVVDVVAVAGILPLWAGMIANTIAYYFFFSVIHDGVHRAITSNKALNDVVCQTAISIYAPFAAMSLFRWAHMEHHRFTNDENDPDDWTHGPVWSLPFRWMTIDVYYAYRAIMGRTPHTQRVLRESLPYIVGGLAFLLAIILGGYGVELFFLWFLPSRLAFIGIGYAFFWLPHSHWPDPERSLKQSEKFTTATLLRLGNENILNPLLQYQNFHLIHHLWPTTPFYNNEKIWKLLEAELRDHELAIVSGLSTRPEYVSSQHATGPHTA